MARRLHLVLLLALVLLSTLLPISVLAQTSIGLPAATTTTGNNPAPTTTTNREPDASPTSRPGGAPGAPGAPAASGAPAPDRSTSRGGANPTGSPTTGGNTPNNGNSNSGSSNDPNDPFQPRTEWPNSGGAPVSTTELPKSSGGGSSSAKAGSFLAQNKGVFITIGVLVGLIILAAIAVMVYNKYIKGESDDDPLPLVKRLSTFGRGVGAGSFRRMNSMNSMHRPVQAPPGFASYPTTGRAQGPGYVSHEGSYPRPPMPAKQAYQRDW
ncbi:hypothetical protein HK104_007616 [Borealophlyctis nickersoniae]|nr:hypothetical protein HK104_007616 [Borealophlyctis nickersoniae]